jgi:tRNA(Ile)-lysidine synthase
MSGAIEELRRKSLPVPDGHYLLGLSGGADSVSLLMILLEDFRERRIKLEAVHINHGIRGNEADEDEHFCHELCQRHGVPFQSYHADLEGKTDEDSAREARFFLFDRLMTEKGADALLLAHNADDQAETFLMRLLRGAGPEGLSCMKADERIGQIRIIRPILTLRRAEIREALLKDGIEWRNDSTNQDTMYLRNRVRKELIPLLERYTGSAVEKINGAAGMIAEDHQELDHQARRLLDRVGRDSMLDAELLASEPVPLQKRVVRLWWKRNGPVLHEHSLNMKQTENLIALLQCEKGKINLPGDFHAVRAGRYLLLQGSERNADEPVAAGGKETVFGNIRMTVGPSAGDPGDGRLTQEVPESMLNGCVIRTRLPGDRIRPFGSAGSRKLQDYLTDRKIPEPFRDRIPLLCRENEVLMVCGVGAGSIPRWDPEKRNVRLTWSGDMPWML